jgi:phosphoenolpyruvate phosphomutase
MVSKIKAGKDVQRSKEFMFIARTEALIAGCDISECIDRSSAYLEAGADLLVIHSKSWSQLQRVLEKWNAPNSLVVIPTMFPEIDLQQLRDAGFKMVIYANQALRAALKAMEDVLTKLLQTGRAIEVEDEILTLDRIHELVGFQEVQS